MLYWFENLIFTVNTNMRFFFLFIFIFLFFSYFLTRHFYYNNSKQGIQTTYLPSFINKVKEKGVLLFFFGTRPEAIKMAPIIWEVEKRAKSKVVVCLSGQHEEMITPLISLFNIHVDCNLNLMKQKLLSQPEFLREGMVQFERVVKNLDVKLIFVQGDTTSALIGSFIAFYSKIPLVHIEAGLRTEDIYNPYPEEMNRRVISQLTKFHFCPTEVSKNALLRENVPPSNIYVVGNPVIDCLKWTLENTKLSDSSIFDSKFKYILVTTHRRENFQLLENICDAILEILEKEKHVKIIYPVHLNPNVRNIVFKKLKSTDRLLLSDPIEYKEFVHYLKNADIILTDSGGIQEECTYLGKPTLVIRENTERKESVGVSKIIGTDKERIIKETLNLLKDKEAYRKMSKKTYPYGSGESSQKIVNILQDFIN